MGIALLGRTHPFPANGRHSSWSCLTSAHPARFVKGPTWDLNGLDLHGGQSAPRLLFSSHYQLYRMMFPQTFTCPQVRGFPRHQRMESNILLTRSVRFTLVKLPLVSEHSPQIFSRLPSVRFLFSLFTRVPNGRSRCMMTMS